MSLLDQIESAAVPTLAALKPQVVITAPNGNKLYIDVSPSPSSGAASSTPLWPQGFDVSLATGTPPTDPTVTTSPSSFFVSQSPVILGAPGPLGVAWGVWFAVLLVIVFAPVVLIALRRRR